MDLPKKWTDTHGAIGGSTAPEHHKDNQLQSLKHPIHHNIHHGYNFLVYQCTMKLIKLPNALS